MATTSSTSGLTRHRDVDDDQAPIGELVERALGGARDLAIHEASLALTELEHDGAQIRTTVVLAVVGASCVSVAVAWAGVAMALSLSLGPIGLAVGAVLAAIGGAVALLAARRQLPASLLGKSRARLERRVARVTEILK